jgi:hypothetical protein
LGWAQLHLRESNERNEVNNMPKKRMILVLGALLIYLVAYSALSQCGRYIEVNRGGNDNKSIWYPAYCGGSYAGPTGRQRASLNVLGWLFIPPVLFDRCFIHPTHDV